MQSPQKTTTLSFEESADLKPDQGIKMQALNSTTMISSASPASPDTQAQPSNVAPFCLGPADQNETERLFKEMLSANKQSPFKQSASTQKRFQVLDDEPLRIPNLQFSGRKAFGVRSQVIDTSESKSIEPEMDHPMSSTPEHQSEHVNLAPNSTF